jgi:cytosine/adenosine deaminase-related metal-dependent hydrolase
MTFYKFQADHIFTGTEMLLSNQVLICDALGIIQQVVDEDEAGDGVQKLKGVLTPGFINCHCHLELSHMREMIPEKTGLVDFVFSVVTQRHFPEEEILDAIARSETEMLQNGIVAVGDISNNLLTLAQKQQKNIHYYNFVEASGWSPDVADARFLRSKQTFDAFSTVSPSAIVPHAPYSVSDNLWKLMKPYYAGKVVSIHNQETSFEDELFIQNSGDFVRMYELMKLDTSFYQPSGKSSLQTYFNELANADHVLLVHNTFTKQPDIDFVKATRPEQSVFFCLCVNANQYIEDAMPPVDMFRENELNIVLGTDSLASNRSLSILDEIRTINQKFPKVPLEELLRWATLNGAKALRMDEMLGSLEKGKQPGVVLLEGVDGNDIKSLQSAKARRLL